ncbi:hypothetical protein IAT40_005019 [Kwoniella sp. CBS 6097]
MAPILSGIQNTVSGFRSAGSRSQPSQRLPREHDPSKYTVFPVIQDRAYLDEDWLKNADTENPATNLTATHAESEFRGAASNVYSAWKSKSGYDTLPENVRRERVETLKTIGKDLETAFRLADLVLWKNSQQTSDATGVPTYSQSKAAEDQLRKLNANIEQQLDQLYGDGMAAASEALTRTTAVLTRALKQAKSQTHRGGKSASANDTLGHSAVHGSSFHRDDDFSGVPESAFVHPHARDKIGSTIYDSYKASIQNVKPSVGSDPDLGVDENLDRCLWEGGVTKSYTVHPDVEGLVYTVTPLGRGSQSPWHQTGATLCSFEEALSEDPMTHEGDVTGRPSGDSGAPLLSSRPPSFSRHSTDSDRWISALPGDSVAVPLELL